jgi:hypothetical protein
LKLIAFVTTTAKMVWVGPIAIYASASSRVNDLRSIL